MKRILYLVSMFVLALAILIPMGADAKKAKKIKWTVKFCTISAIDGTTITATKSGTTYTIDAANALIKRKYNATAAFSEVMVGDIIHVKGTMTGTNIVATRIMDTSIQKYKGTFQGTVTSVDTLNNQFVFQSKARGPQTVNICAAVGTNCSQATAFKYRNKSPKTFAELQVGDKIVVHGIWNNTHSLVYNTTKINILTKH